MRVPTHRGLVLWVREDTHPGHGHFVPLTMHPSLSGHRKSHMEQAEVYFWTATIHQWQHLLAGDEYKEVILDCWQYLTDQGKADVFAFVIMSNHLHAIWRVNEPNGKESPQGSFLKHTAHRFQKMLRQEGGSALERYRVNAANKKYEFWQRDSLTIPLFTRKVALQKLKYIHNNPLAEHLPTGLPAGGMAGRLAIGSPSLRLQIFLRSLL